MKATNPTVTVMFVDIVGFSISAERMPAPEVFQRLRSMLTDLAAIVKRNGGIVDKTIGDGFLCFFGCGYDGKVTTDRHADQAIRAACELQRFAADRVLKSTSVAEPVFPLRVGLNTAQVFIGNLGAANKPEYTIIGHGVNIAQRLEFACESFRIMLSMETLSAWSEFGGGSVRIHKRQVQMKHRETVFDAFEMDPFESDPDTLKQAMNVYRERAGLRRKENREDVGADILIAVHPERVDGTLVNYSRSGLAIRTTTYFSRGTVLTLSLESTAKRLSSLCRKYKVGPVLTGEVRWGVPAGDAYLHGLELVRLSQAERDGLFQAFQEYLSLTLKRA